MIWDSLSYEIFSSSSKASPAVSTATSYRSLPAPKPVCKTRVVNTIDLLPEGNVLPEYSSNHFFH